jgi:GNAT superfamily N-acetyltransferase
MCTLLDSLVLCDRRALSRAIMTPLQRPAAAAVGQNETSDVLPWISQWQTLGRGEAPCWRGINWQVVNKATGGFSRLDIRLARPEDAVAVAQVHVRAWQTAYRNLLPGQYLDGLRAEDRAARYDLANRDPTRPSTLVAVDAESICGFATVACAGQGDAPDCGELCALYVSPERWGCGIGVALVRAARNRLLLLGYRQAVLWILLGNARAERFYQRDGWTCDGLQRTATVWDATVEEVRYSRDLQRD